MSKLCCFFCPQRDFKEKDLADVCPICGNTYGLPIASPPSTIGEFQIIKPISRGFYAATFVAQRKGLLQRPLVLKVVSKRVYDFFAKDFVQECKDHAKIADGLEHVVQIIDGYENVEVAFGNTTLTCHVAVLQFVNGEPLGALLKRPEKLSARSIAQIGIDLFRMVDEFRGKVAFHNDLHGENIMVEKIANRADAIDPTLRTLAIDLGSISDASKSDSQAQRLGDIHWIANHLLRMVDHLLRDSDKTSDRKSTRLNSSHRCISYAVFCLKKKTTPNSPFCLTTSPTHLWALIVFRCPPAGGQLPRSRQSREARLVVRATPASLFF